MFWRSKIACDEIKSKNYFDCCGCQGKGRPVQGVCPNKTNAVRSHRVNRFSVHFYSNQQLIVDLIVLAAPVAEEIT